MALDQQQNWTVSMAENLEQSLKNSRIKEAKRNESIEKSRLDENTKAPTWTKKPVYLPDEILVQILDYVARFHDSQYTLASCCRLSRQWFSAAVPLLYRRPQLYGKNYGPFVGTICPSKNLHVRESPLAELVKVLNMSALVHQGSKSELARLLGRTKYSLEEYTAPQTGFADNSFPALAKAHRLRVLDLCLVSESPPLLRLFKTISHLENLTTLRLPRSAGFAVKVDASLVVWPPKLENLSLSGGIDAHFLYGVVAFPQSLRSLTIEHCPLLQTNDVLNLLRTPVRLLPNLDTLKLANLPRLHDHALDGLLFILPGLRKLSVSVDYITPDFFDLDVTSRSEELQTFLIDNMTQSEQPDRHLWRPDRHCQLQTLELTNSGNPGVEDKISPIDLVISVDDGTLPNLRQVRVAKSLLWHGSATRQDLEALSDTLKEAGVGKEDVDKGLEAGVWTFDG
ncbi:unnamed protein product [Zymoseptoria tritici ST99CH_3D7]|uniref:F-box domain-containing protein n=1 Tax=Zymoseptoria tritici (strain ST99CH_3D7) TaxID=1276538 RepID=A0A1X7S9A7_ZYMT9|nr:unnamed protein product [Zymoseptoria tritici ST99CH_3D7]